MVKAGGMRPVREQRSRVQPPPPSQVICDKMFGGVADKLVGCDQLEVIEVM